MPVHKYRDKLPVLGKDVYIAPGAHVIGDVEIGDRSNVWFNAVIRGDVYYIRIGEDTNVQDNTVIHVTTGKHPTIIGNRVTIGHSAILHGCTVEDGCLIGMGAMVMDEAVVQEGAFVGAGSLVTPGTVIPAGMLAIGRPARVKRPVSDAEKQHLLWAPPHYVELAAEYKDSSES